MAGAAGMLVRVGMLLPVAVILLRHQLKAQAQLQQAKARQLKVLHLKPLAQAALVGSRFGVAHTAAQTLKHAILAKIETASVKCCKNATLENIFQVFYSFWLNCPF
jgi:hypothetical protein